MKSLGESILCLMVSILLLFMVLINLNAQFTKESNPEKYTKMGTVGITLSSVIDYINNNNN